MEEAINRYTASALAHRNDEALIDEETGGIWVEPMGEKGVGYRFREMFKYCEQQGKEPGELTDDEVKAFEVPRKGSGAKLRSEREGAARD